MKKAMVVLVLCISMVMLAGCGGSSDKSAGATASKNPGNAYRVVTVDESGAPVAGVMVQFCSETMCQMGETDADGIASFPDNPEGTYTVHVYDVPEGYADDATEYPAPETYGDINIVIKAK